jgi:hypothetical protein
MNRFFGFAKNVLKYLKFRRLSFGDSNDLITAHFQVWSEVNHQNREGLRIALSYLYNKPANIIETGTSAYGTDSSRLFDSYIRNFGGNFYSVDISPYPHKRLRFQHSKNSHFYISDSIRFLESVDIEGQMPKIDLVYLDSWDVDWANPHPSAVHGLEEFRRVVPFLHSGGILVIDDTPIDLKWIPIQYRQMANEYKNEYGVLPGKGALVVRELQDNAGARKVWHDYNCVYVFE